MAGSTRGTKRRSPVKAGGLAGYSWLLQEFGLAVLPPRHLTYIGTGRREFRDEGRARLELPAAYLPDNSIGAQLEFALKWDGVDLSVLGPAFRAIVGTPAERALTEHIRSRPTGQYARRLWFLFELLTGKRLDLPDASGGPLTPVLDEAIEFTGPPERSTRHRVVDNLLGNADFCPQVERTPPLDAERIQALAREAAAIVAEHDEDAVHRAVDYLYTKETRSSFALEREKPSTARMNRFVRLLRETPVLERIRKADLVRLQQETVDPRFVATDWREDQVYVGETLTSGHERVHFAAPKPADVPRLMDGWIRCADRLLGSSVDPVVQAAVLSFGFVFIHPFGDGNGRLHRLLLHTTLARAGFTPKGLVLPVSAVMLARRREYDAALERFSRPLMDLLDYELDDELKLTVEGETSHLYSWFDATPMTEALVGWLEETISVELRRELDFITAFREARTAMDDVVSLPDRELNLFVRFCLQNHGRLGAAKREKYFASLRDDEVAALETIVTDRLLPLAPTP